MLYTIYNIESKEVLYCQDFETEPTLALPLKATSQLNTKSFNKEMFDGENFYEGSPFPIEKYAKEVNDYHNQMLDDVLIEKNYLSLGEVALWLNDANYGEFLSDTKLTADDIENYSQNILVTKQPSNLPNVIFATGLGFIDTPPSGFGIGWMTIGTTNIVG